MKLQIINNKGTIEVVGDFTSDNTLVVKDHFNYLLDHYEEVVMSLQKVKSIDTKAIDVLKDIYAKAHKRSKVLFVLGKQNDKIRNAFIRSGIVHVFRNDY